MSEIVEKIRKRLKESDKLFEEVGGRIPVDDEDVIQLINEYELDEAIIDKMSELMTSPVHSKEWVKNYFRNEVKKECSQ